MGGGVPFIRVKREKFSETLLLQLITPFFGTSFHENCVGYYKEVVAVLAKGSWVSCLIESYRIVSHIIISIFIYPISSYPISLYRIASHRVVSPRIVSYRIVSYRIVSHRVVSHRIVSHRIVSYRILSYSIVSYRIVSYRIVSYRIVSYRIVSHCIVSYRIVLYLPDLAFRNDVGFQHRLENARLAHEVCLSLSRRLRHRHSDSFIPSNVAGPTRRRGRFCGFRFLL